MSTSFKGLVGSSVFRKQLVALTGLMGVGFILAHMSGNLLLFGGPESLNHYAEVLRTIPELLWVARLGLVAALVLHISLTVTLLQENRAARGGQAYQVEASKRDDVAFGRKTMILTGAVVLAYLAIHLYDFTVASKGPENPATVVAGMANGESLALYGLVWNKFQSWPRVLLYVVAVCCVGLHLTHGFQSLFQTIGFYHERYTPLLMKAGVALGVLVAVGFSLVPLFVVLKGTPPVP